MAASPSSSASPASPGASAAPSFVQRMIVLTIKLGTGSFGESGSNTLTLGSITDPNMCPRCFVHAEFAPTPHPISAIITVYGLTLSQINQLTIPGLPYGYRQNQIQVQAGDNINGMATVYTGNVIWAYPKSSQPEMAFVMVSVAATPLQLTPVPPISFQGAIDGVTVLQQIAKAGGMTLENNGGVTGTLTNPYFANTTWEQFKACADALNCTAMYDPVKNVLAIWPKNGTRDGPITTITYGPGGNGIDYPEFQQGLIKSRSLFVPGSYFLPGGKVNINGSQFTAANGTWNVTNSVLDIAAQLPDGPWEVTMIGSRTWPGQASS